MCYVHNQRYDTSCATLYICIYEGGSKSFRPDQLFKVTEIKQLCYFSSLPLFQHILILIH